MKKVVFFLVIILALLVTACSNTKTNSEDKRKYWVGTYIGTISSIDSNSIELKIILRSDYSYKLVKRNILEEEEEYIIEGKYEVEDNIIILEDKEVNKDINNRYIIGEDTLINLDNDRENTKEEKLGEKSILKKNKVKVEGNITIKFGTSIKL